MKKILWFFIAVFAIGLLFTGGCKKSSTTNNDDNDNDALIDGTQFDYYMALFRMEDNPTKESSYQIYIYKEKGEPIETLQLKVNNQEIDIAYQPIFEAWISNEPIMVEQGTNITFDLAINSTKYTKTFDLKSCYTPTVNWPETIDLSTETNFTWSLHENAMFQEFDGYCTKTMSEEEQSQSKILETSDRSFKMPANWLPTDYDKYTFMLSEYNYYKDSSKLLALTAENSLVDYGYSKNRVITLKEKIDHIKQVISRIK